MKILVIGAKGFLGSYVYASCLRRNDMNVIGTAFHQYSGNGLLPLDVVNKLQLEKTVDRVRPDCVINCAAMTNVDECEKDPKLARAVNSIGVKYLADACKTRNAKLLHISTDSVFDGTTGNYTEESEPNPLNVYASTKLEGEKFASTVENHIIVRTNFYGLDPNGKGLLNWILSNLTQDMEIRGFTDVIFNPLWVSDLASCILELASTPFQGILNCAGGRILSKYDFIRNAALLLGYSDSKIKRAVLDDISFVSPRPKNTSLSNKKMNDTLKTKIHKIEDVVCDQSFNLYRKKDSEEI